MKLLLPRRLRSLCSRYGVRRLEVFGSFARGTARRGSDVDVIATFRENPGLRLVSFQRELEKGFGRPVDLLEAQTVEEMTNPYRRASINEARQVIYEEN